MADLSVVRGDVVSSGTGKLFGVTTQGTLEEKAPVATAVLSKVANFEYLFVIAVGGKAAMTLPVSNDLQMLYDKANKAVHWITMINNQVLAWRFDFADEEEEKQFKLNMSIALMESSRKESFAKTVKEEDKEWVTQAAEADVEAKADYKETDDYEFSDVLPPVRDRFSMDSIAQALPADDSEAESAAEESESDSGPSSPVARPQTRTSAYATPVHEGRIRAGGRAEHKGLATAPPNLDKNRNLAVGMSINRTYVTRGSRIGAFKYNDEDQLEYVGKIDSVRNLEGDLFSPTKSMLHQRDSRLLMLAPDDKKAVFAMDLHRGEVIEEWRPEEGLDIRSMAPTTKYNQLTTDPTLIAVAKNALFSIDPRTKEKTAHKQMYVKAPKFTCISAIDADPSGRVPVVTGTETGEISLYSQVGQRAKTLLPGLGDPIIGIDVTADGKWILATTRAYLLVIPTEMPDDAKGRTGFEVRMGKQKPVPRKLQLDPLDIAKHNMGHINFTPAHFNVGEGTEEWIVTSTGPFIVTWNFRKVRQNVRSDYKIKKTTSTVVADQFRYNLDDQVVVSTTDNVYLEKRQLKKKKATSTHE